MMSGRVFTLRGKVQAVDDGQLINNHLLLDNVSPDRTKAWRVITAYIWPVTYRATAASDGILNLTGNLATDTMFHPQFEHLADPSDNRLIGWAQQTYNVRDATADFITPNGVPLCSMCFLMDPDHLVSKELYLNFATTSDDDSAPKRDWGYMVVLEEMKVTPTESIFAQIKGMGQDVTAA